MSTVFTQIIEGHLPGRVVYEDSLFFCIVPKSRFVNPGHLLVIPKEEVDYIFDLDEVIYQKLWSLAKQIAIPLKELTNAKRIGIAVEGFSVPHVHIHLCPINNMAELDPNRNEKWTEEERNSFVNELKTLLKKEGLS